MPRGCRFAAAISVFALVVILGAPTPTQAGEVYCSSFGGSVHSHVNDNLQIDIDCSIVGSTVNGNVEFAGPYHLRIHNSTVNGNIECRNRGSVAIHDSRIHGNIEECATERPWGAGALRFKAALDGFQEVPAISTAAKGRFFARVDREDGKLQYALRYRGLEGGNVRFAHIHFGRAATNGGVIAFLCSNEAPPARVDTPLCPAEGETLWGELIPSDVIGPGPQGIDPGLAGKALLAFERGAAYVNVHTRAFPDGEIRGQIEAKKRMHMQGDLDSRRRPPEIPPGHLPPPGECRIWYEGRPPGQQPPPGDCHTLERQVPNGAWLIRG